MLLFGKAGSVGSQEKSGRDRDPEGPKEKTQEWPEL